MLFSQFCLIQKDPSSVFLVQIVKVTISYLADQAGDTDF